MILFLKLISYTKRKLVESFKKRVIQLICAFIVLSAISVAVDIFVYWGYFSNILRCALAILNSYIIFSICFAIRIKLDSLREQGKEPSKLYLYFKSLSYRQRVNVAIVIFVATIMWFLLLAQTQQPGYTVTSAFLFAVWIFLIYFVKPTYDEIVDSHYELDDTRDMKKSNSR